jgi:hypothetical protein
MVMIGKKKHPNKKVSKVSNQNKVDCGTILINAWSGTESGTE